MANHPRERRLLSASQGGTDAVELLILLGFLAIVAIAVVRQLGETVEAKFAGQAGTLATLNGGSGGGTGSQALGVSGSVAAGVLATRWDQSNAAGAERSNAAPLDLASAANSGASDQAAAIGQTDPSESASASASAQSTGGTATGDHGFAEGGSGQTRVDPATSGDGRGGQSGNGGGGTGQAVAGSATGADQSRGNSRDASGDLAGGVESGGQAVQPRSGSGSGGIVRVAGGETLPGQGFNAAVTGARGRVGGGRGGRNPDYNGWAFWASRGLYVVAAGATYLAGYTAPACLGCAAAAFGVAIVAEAAGFALQLYDLSQSDISPMDRFWSAARSALLTIAPIPWGILWEKLKALWPR